MNTELLSQVNWLAVLVAAIAYFALGAIWFAKPVFGNRWATAHGINMADPDLRKGVAQIMIGSFILMLIVCIALAVLAARMSMHGAASGIKLGLITGLGFSCTAISINHLYLKKPFLVHFIDGGYHVVAQVIAAVIICVWQ